MMGSYLFALGMVAAVMGGAFALVRLAQVRGVPIVRDRAIRIVAQQSLGMGASLLLVDVEGGRVLVGISKAGVTFHEPGPLSLSSSKPCAPVPDTAHRKSLRTGSGRTEFEDNVACFSTVLKRAGAR